MSEVFSDILSTLATAISQIRKQDGYNIDFPTVQTYGAGIAQSRTFPAVTLTPNGTATIEVIDESDVRLSREIEISAAVSEKDQTKNHEAILGISADLRDLIYTPVSLGTGYLAIFPEDPHEELVVLFDKAILSQRWRILYYESGIRPGTAVGTDVYGSQDVYDQSLDKIYSALNTLMTGDLSSLSPKFSYLYKEHRKAALLLNAATVEIMQSDSERIGGLTTTSVMRHDIIVSVRIHTAYIGGEMKTLENLRLINSVETYLLENVNLGGGYHIDGTSDINPSETFYDSGTLGGSIIIRVSKRGDY